MLKVFGVLAKGKRLRGTAFDIFGYTHERRVERQLIRDYEARLNEIVGNLTGGNHAVAVGLASIPEKIRGFGHVKARHLQVAQKEEAELLARFRSPQPTLAAAAE
jgi:indolepyruvate ferredoxin oxidoreductase